ncbi:uncharacterized protein G2W53_020616 [Senna tora]|uniref:Uncharacterized protein n=1 Tax=Senna tora TaxID=362788 RepID=A0A834WH31_9FABA|nr:uncharacterized protein G2W53_020616 [Senna tora]
MVADGESGPGPSLVLPDEAEQADETKERSKRIKKPPNWTKDYVM